MRRTHRYALGAGIGLLIAAIGCGSQSDSAPPGQPLDTSDAGPDDSSAPGPAPGTVPDGIFVAPNGADGAPGTAAAPLKSIGAAVAKAATIAKPVIVCSSGIFREAIVIKAGLTLKGNYDCAREWRSTNDRATIAPTTGVPITIDGSSNQVSLSYLRAKAPDAVESSQSSIALFAAASTDVRLDHVELQAGAGADGETPPPTPPGNLEPAPRGEDGYSFPQWTPSGCWSCNAPDDPCCYPGGIGGSKSSGLACNGVGGLGGRGGNVLRGYGTDNGGQGGPMESGGLGGEMRYYDPARNGGNPGRDGAPGRPGQPATTGIGTVSRTGYAATNRGGEGQPGPSGGGGGGGAGGYSSGNRSGDVARCSVYWIGGGGGQGGFGGCGGAPGRAAGAGGASIGLLAVDARVAIAQSTITTATGGEGGDSSLGADGQPGGAGGNGGQAIHVTGQTGNNEWCNNTIYGDGSPGGHGGRGGKGGSGGAGGGGPSLGILASGQNPQTEALTINLGRGGKGGSSFSGQDGADGVVGQIVVLGADAGSVSAPTGDKK